MSMNSSEVLSSTSTESVWTEKSYSIDVHPPSTRFVKQNIRRLERQLVKLKQKTRRNESSVEDLGNLAEDLQKSINEKKTRLENVGDWHKMIVKSSERWLEIWESDFGKKLLNERSVKTAENAILVSSITKQIEYAKVWIDYFQRKKQWDENVGQKICRFIRDESVIFEEEIHQLRRECLEWEKRAAYNRARTLEMVAIRQTLEKEVNEKRLVASEIKDDINEFERELLAVSYTLDQIYYR
uniref:Uncharacterized protein n=1 Tax=Panagrolaimus sp. JU765 TaxID=591449 RepID=A0AC34QX32_9BILA